MATISLFAYADVEDAHELGDLGTKALWHRRIVASSRGLDERCEYGGDDLAGASERAVAAATGFRDFRLHGRT